MKFDLIVNAPLEPRVFRVVTVINGVPCISVTKLDTDNFPSETIKVYCGDGSGNATSQHDTPDGPVQEVHIGDFVAVCAKQAVDSPIMVNSYYISDIRNDHVTTVYATL